jgi:hypothetical protein
MNYKVVQEDIFRHVNEEKARFVQCLSADYAAGKGIAVEFNKYYNIGEILRNHCYTRQLLARNQELYTFLIFSL